MAWQEVLDALQLSYLFRARHRRVTAEAVEAFLVLDESHSSSIAAAIGRARENGRNVREHLSTELWEALNSTYLELHADGRAELAAHPHEFYRRVRSRCQLVAGAAAETMPRLDAWRFLLLGRLVERAEMTCRLLRVRAPRARGDEHQDEIHFWLVMLNAVSALESYARRFGAEITPARVLELLVLSPEFPRSVLFCLRAAETQLGALQGGVATPSVRRALSRMRAELEYQDVSVLLERGAEDSSGARRGIAQIAERIEAATSRRDRPRAPCHEAV
jgi:uncharacterized alpha-E superfamily protein